MRADGASDVRILAAILKRVLQLLVLSLLVTSATYFLAQQVPGDFFSAQELDPNANKQTLERMRQRYGLDQPAPVQFARWLGRCAHLDFGTSHFYQAPVRTVVLQALATTLWIGLPALVFGVAGGILLGTLHAIHRDDSLGITLEILSIAALATPTLVLGLGALLLASLTQWFPLGGMNAVTPADSGLVTWLLDRLYHLVLPAGCLTIPVLVYVERIQCAAAQSAWNAPFVRAARARGLGRVHIFLHYLLRPSLTPVVSTSGPLLAAVLSGSLILEVVFAWPGMGQVTLNSLLNRDTPLVAGCVIMSTVLLVAGNFAADMLLLILDPRIKVRGGAL